MEFKNTKYLKNTFTLFPTLALPRSGQGSNINSSQPKAPLNMTANIISPFCYYCKKKGENPLKSYKSNT